MKAGDDDRAEPHEGNRVLQKPAVYHCNNTSSNGELAPEIIQKQRQRAIIHRSAAPSALHQQINGSKIWATSADSALIGQQHRPSHVHDRSKESISTSKITTGSLSNTNNSRRSRPSMTTHKFVSCTTGRKRGQHK
ncbi:hypothetical protein ACLOJK_000635 [Asimina triloba]